jgi:group I intron endonuclease
VQNYNNYYNFLNNSVKYSSISFPIYSEDKKRDNNLNLKIVSLKNRLLSKPIYVFENPINNRDKIRECTKGLSGIYLWFNKINGKCYIGSGSELYKRISNYFQPVYLKRSYPIINAINKYGINSFNLVILEILGDSQKIDRTTRLFKEDYYLSSYLPEYNILEKGTSSLNYKHSIETRAKIRAYALSRDKNTIIYSKEFLFKQSSLSKSGRNNPMFGRKWTEEMRKKLTKPIYVYNSKTLELIDYFSETVIATKKLKIGYHTLRRYIRTRKSYKEKLFSYEPIFKRDKDN